MDGATRKAGAVAGVHNVKNPILLAREVMQHSPHVMMAGAGAEAFAKERGVEQVDPAYFRTERRWQQLQRALEEDATGQAHADTEVARQFGTAGALALEGKGPPPAGHPNPALPATHHGRKQHHTHTDAAPP